ncbi:leucine-rich repeat-containing protein 70-like [Branchiostoma lanceolatum]|uniref:leucine-rich repeat-containing protein 70-like n=1 Tax=Branchiostoma lanceolatum TaxID=7740 RepID=UPI0034539A07
MGRKLRHMLIFLLIILKELSMLEADCSCASPSSCKCFKLGLTSIPQNLQTSIFDLQLGDNNIRTVNRSELLQYWNLVKLNLTKNDLPKLRSLNLGSNKITMIQPGAFANLPNLRSLNLDSNKITMIQPGAFPNLPQLKQITKIPPGVFANLAQLQDLSLMDNKITMIQSGTFANLPRLQKLDLTGNLITKIDSGALANLPQLQDLSLRYNKMSAIFPSAFGRTIRALMSDKND